MSELMPLSITPPPQPAHPEIEIMQRRVLALFSEQRAYLEAKPSAFLDELMHRSDDERRNVTFSRRTAAEINHAACVLILESRASSSLTKTNISHRDTEPQSGIPSLSLGDSVANPGGAR